MADDTSSRIALLVIAVAQAVISIRYLRASGAGSIILGRRQEGVLLSAAIASFYMAYGVGVLVYVLHPDWMSWSAVPLAAWARWLGIVPLLLGAGWIVWSLHHLGTNLTISISTKADHALITTGPYRWVRHPLYSGGMIETVGVCLLIANWFVSLSAVLFWALIALRTPMEEEQLTKAFGDTYRRYCQQVGRFIPKAAAFGVVCASRK